jgi:uncharacterized protein Yka (UPF0111/DUF47 family)
MFSLQRLLSKSDKFFDLLEASAEESQHAVEALVEMMKAPQEGRSLDECILSRRQEKRLNEEITTLLCSTFVTPLEREDIESLSRALYRIPKTAEKFGERLLLSQAQVHFELFDRQIALVQQAIETLREMVRQLRGTVSLDKVKANNDRLHHYEGEGDKLMLDLLREIYSGRYEALQMIVMRDLFELLEKVIDRCRDAGNVIFQIVLKNS